MATTSLSASLWSLAIVTPCEPDKTGYKTNSDDQAGNGQVVYVHGVAPYVCSRAYLQLSCQLDGMYYNIVFIAYLYFLLILVITIFRYLRYFISAFTIFRLYLAR